MGPLRPNEKPDQENVKEKVYRGLPAEDAKLINTVYSDKCLIKPVKKAKRSEALGDWEDVWTYA